MLKKSGCTAVWLLCGFAMFTQNFHDLALNYIKSKSESWELTFEDISELRITDSHTSSLSGVRHIYIQQFRNDIPVRKGLASVHISPEGEILHFTNSLISDISSKINQSKPAISAERAVVVAAKKLNIPTQNLLKTINKEMTTTENHKFEGGSISAEPIPASLVFDSDKEGNLLICWKIEIMAHDYNNNWVIYIDAETGEETNRTDGVVKCNFGSSETSSLNFPKFSCSHNHLELHLFDFEEKPLTGSATYNAFHLPIESPLYGSRSEKDECDIADATAAPLGWHDDADGSTVDEFTRGNHVYAYYSPLGLQNPIPDEILCPGGIYASGNVPWPTGANSYKFVYNADLNTATALNFIKDAITNLFVWNNYCHDVSYLYGFDEAAGNFQHTNHTGNGTGGDLVLAHAQDGTKTNNASWTRKVEGTKPIMRMHLWNTNLPTTILDSSFDNLVIAHEFGHGITSRLLGGPNNIDCFSSTEHGDEGWADFFGLLMTLQDIDGDMMLEENVIGEGIRGIGNYLRNDGTSGCDDPAGNGTCGLRPTAYSTDLTINPFTYGDVPGMAQPHGTGFVWCTMLWEMTWKLINTHGFESDIYATSSTAGNIVAMKLVIEGLKNTACDPTFINMRDAILAADVTLFSSANQDIIWEAFAKRGLGFSATAGGNEAFDLPTVSLEKSVNKEEAEIGQSVTYTLTAKNNSTSTITNVVITDVVPAHLNVTSISNGGSESGGTITWPAFASIGAGNSETVTFTAEIENTATPTDIISQNDLETSESEFTRSALWLWVDNEPSLARSGDRFFAINHTTTVSSGELVMTLDLSNSENYHLSFWHVYDVENGYDGGVVEVSTNNGSSYSDLGSKMIKNGYNGSILPKEIMGITSSVLGGRAAFTGQISNYINTIIDLSSYSGNSNVKIRFRFATDENNDIYQGSGWRIDDFSLLDLSNIKNEGCVTETSQSYMDCGDVGDLGTIVWAAGALPIELVDFQVVIRQNDVLLKWETAFEKDVSGFEIQRSIDTRNWEKIGWQDAENHTDRITQYEFTDKNVSLNTLYYYRLKMTDLDGYFEYSDTRSAIINEDNFGLKIFPNPTSNLVNLQLETPTNEHTTIEIYNPNGQKIVKTDLAVGESFISIDVSEFPPNVYFIKMASGRKIIYEKFILQKN